MGPAGVTKSLQDRGNRRSRSDERTADALALSQIHRFCQGRHGSRVPPQRQLRLGTQDAGLHRLDAMGQGGVQQRVQQLADIVGCVQGEMGARQRHPFQAPGEPDRLAGSTQQVDGGGGRPGRDQRLRLGHGAPVAEQIGQPADAGGPFLELARSRGHRGGITSGCRELDGGDGEHEAATGIGAPFARRQSPVDLHGGPVELVAGQVGQRQRDVARRRLDFRAPAAAVQRSLCVARPPVAATEPAVQDIQQRQVHLGTEPGQRDAERPCLGKSLREIGLGSCEFAGPQLGDGKAVGADNAIVRGGRQVPPSVRSTRASSPADAVASVATSTLRP